MWVAVFDTNTLISALLSLRGYPFRCLALAKMGTVQSVTCQEIVDEFEEKLLTRFAYSVERARAAADEVRGFSQLVSITNTLQISSDPDDNKVLECAVIGRATHVVTGDHRHLLPLGGFQGIPIVTAARFVELVSLG